MASTQTTGSPKVFIDSSALIAAPISPKGAARGLVLRGLRGEFRLCISLLVLDETERNLRRKAPAVLPAFQVLREALAGEYCDPSSPLVLNVARIVVLKDAPIVAAALHAEADYLATYDWKHLLSQKESIKTNFGIIVATPDEILRDVR